MIQNQIINEVINFIFSKIDCEISVDDVAEFCGFSKFYISRLFKAETGESIYSFIKRIRIEQSAWRLKVEQSRSITEIGEKYGYSSSNYATLFKQYYNTTPVTFRKEITKKSIEHPFYHGINNKLETYEECCKKITIEILPDFFVLYERYKGNYHNLSDAWCNFTEKYKSFITGNTKFLELTYEDPSISDKNACLYDVCMTVEKNDNRLSVQKTAAVGITSAIGTEPAPNTMTLKGGKFAIYHYAGCPQLIYSAYQSFFCSWLVETGNEVDNRNGFDIYRKIDSKTMYMELDICIPIK